MEADQRTSCGRPLMRTLSKTGLLQTCMQEFQVAPFLQHAHLSNPPNYLAEPVWTFKLKH